MDKRLLILGCANRKRDSGGLLPALDRYDGPAYRVIRNFLRDYQWPEDVSIAVLSAEYGLFGILKGIRQYDKRMDLAAAAAKAPECSTILSKWATSHRSVHVALGKDYMPAVQPGLETASSRITGIHGRYRSETSSDQNLPNGKLATSKSRRQSRKRVLVATATFSQIGTTSWIRSLISMEIPFREPHVQRERTNTAVF